MNIKKYVIGFAIFFAYFLVATNLVNKVSALRKLTNLGSSS